MTQSQTIDAYFKAVVASCSVALGMNYLSKKVLHTHAIGAWVARLTPFTAVAAAGTLNVYLMRKVELDEGIAVYDNEGKYLGHSKEAAANALAQVAFSRVVTAFPILTIPPAILSVLKKWEMFSKSPKLLGLANFGLIGISLTAALPLAIGLFPQHVSTHVNNLEKEFQSFKDSRGNKIATVYYNKGL